MRKAYSHQKKFVELVYTDTIIKVILYKIVKANELKVLKTAKC